MREQLKKGALYAKLIDVLEEESPTMDEATLELLSLVVSLVDRSSKPDEEGLLYKANFFSKEGDKITVQLTQSTPETPKTIQ